MPFDGEKLHLEIGPQNKDIENVKPKNLPGVSSDYQAFNFRVFLKLYELLACCADGLNKTQIKSYVRHLAGYSKNCGGRTGQDARDAHLNLKN